MDEPATTTPRRLGRDARLLSPFDLADALTGAWHRNERRLAELDGLEAGIAAARLRLDSSAAGRALVEAHLARLLARREACLSAAREDARLAGELSREWDSRRVARRAVGG